VSDCRLRSTRVVFAAILLSLKSGSVSKRLALKILFVLLNNVCKCMQNPFVLGLQVKDQIFYIFICNLSRKRQFGFIVQCAAKKYNFNVFGVLSIGLK
jgi:hypothetical protein